MNSVRIVVDSCSIRRGAKCARAAVGLHVIARFAVGRRSTMYSPVLSEKATKTLYRIKKAYRKPMTVIADDLIRQSLSGIDKQAVCEACIADKNNDCGSCYLKGKENSNVEHADK